MGANYVIIAGERRFRASKLAHQTTIPAIVRKYEKSKMIELALIENLQREDLSAVEEAKAYNQIMRELDLTQKEVAERVGKTRSYVTNMLGLLNLPENVLKLVDEKKISMGHARALSKLLDKERINYIANQIVQKNLSVREVEKLVVGEEKKNPSNNKKSKTYAKYEQNLGLNFKSRVSISEKKVTFNFKNEEEMISFVNKFLKEN
jgi:ParB family chromosome partitioning protein